VGDPYAPTLEARRRAMDAEQEMPAVGFPLVSDGGNSAWTELVVGGNVGVKSETVYEPTDDRFGYDPKKPIGTVTIAHSQKRQGPFVALFSLKDGSEVSIHGRTPGEDESTRWLGRQTVHVDDATGVFAPWEGQDISLESENPKRWG
jgi:hypothetical protein